MNTEAVIAITNVAAICLIAFGLHGCSSGSEVYSIAVIFGACMVIVPKVGQP